MTTIKVPNTAGWERDVAKHGMRVLCDGGYHPLLLIPHNDPQSKFEKIKGKAPGYMKTDGMWAPAAGWKEASKKPNPVEAFRPIGRKTRFVPNIGVLCGLPVEIGGEHVGYLTALDVDTACPHVLTTFSELFGYSNPVRRGRRGGTFLCITDQRESKDFKRSPDAEGYIDGDDENGVQIISGDKQTVVLGVHPVTLKRFKWETTPMDGEAEPTAMLPVSQLPVISTAQLEEVLASLGFERGKGAKATTPEVKSKETKRSKEMEADLKKSAVRDFDEVDEELGITAVLEQDAPLRRMLKADHNEVRDHSTHDMNICRMLRRHLGPKFDHHTARAVLLHFPSCSEEEKITDHHVANIMSKCEDVKPFEEKDAATFSAPVIDPEDDEDNVPPDVQATREADALKRANLAERDKRKREADDSNKAAAAGKPPKSEPWYESATFIPVDLDINKLPPRPYVYSTYLLRGHVTLLSASGGVGKSAWFLFAAIDMACGVDHLDAGDLKRPRKVLVYNAEDDIEEMYRRAGAYMLDHKFTDEMRRHVRENLTLISGVGGGLRLADSVDGSVMLKKNTIRLLAQLLKERRIEVIGLDPLVALHSISENANSEMNELIEAIRNLTVECNVATLVAHHDKKNINNKSVDEASQDDARGAGTITTPVRVILSMKRLSKADIRRLNIPADVAASVFALTKGAKSNYSARDKSARLFQTISVYADNGTDEFEADSNVSLRPYKVRAVGPRISDDQRDAILVEIAKGTYRSDPQASGPLVDFISEVVGADDADAEWRKHVKGVLSEWLAVGWLKVDKAKRQGHKREVPVFKIGPVTPPPASFEAVDDEEDDD